MSPFLLQTLVEMLVQGTLIGMTFGFMLAAVLRWWL